MRTSIPFCGLFHRSKIQTPTQQTLLSHYRDLPTGRQEQVIAHAHKKSALHHLKVLLFTVLTGVTGGLAATAMTNPQTLETMGSTPLKTVLLSVLALPAAAYCGVKSVQHRVQDGQLQMATAALALEANQAVSIGGVALSPDQATGLLDMAGQAARQNVFSSVRQERVAAAAH